jgi:ElaB/YqjD/DUF883 family membrane-anchored ribosome-binding protein
MDSAGLDRPRVTGSRATGIRRPVKNAPNSARALIAQERRALVARPARKPGRSPPKPRKRPARAIADYVQQHPAATIAIAVTAGLLLRAALASLADQRMRGAGTRMPGSGQRALSQEQTSSRRRTHDVGAADMEFTTHHPGEKKILFRFAWKKRPVDAPETDWPTDHMAFTATRPDGTHTAFRFTRKTRPVPAGTRGTPGADTRPGLGRATMEFISSRPGRRDFRFTWDKVPADASREAAPTGSNEPA